MNDEDDYKPLNIRPSDAAYEFDKLCQEHRIDPPENLMMLNFRKFGEDAKLAEDLFNLMYEHYIDSVELTDYE